MNKRVSVTGRAKIISKGQYQSLLALSKQYSTRDYMLFFLSGNLGLRVGELVRLRVEDIQHNQIHIPFIKFKGKRLKEKELPASYQWTPLPEIVKSRLEEYLKISGITSGWIFPGKNSKEHFSRSSVQKLFYSYCDTLKIKASVHSLRHYRGSAIYSATKDLRAVASVLRHKTLRSTDIYVHPTMQDKLEILELSGIEE